MTPAIAALAAAVLDGSARNDDAKALARAYLELAHEAAVLRQSLNRANDALRAVPVACKCAWETPMRGWGDR